MKRAVGRGRGGGVLTGTMQRALASAGTAESERYCEGERIKFLEDAPTFKPDPGKIFP